RHTGRPLTRLEHARVEIRLELPVALDDLGVARYEAGAPAGHVPALRRGEDLDADLLRPPRLEEARRAVTVEGDLRVRVVVDDHQVVLAGEFDGALEEAGLHDRAGRIVGVVEEEHVRPGRSLARD